MCIHINDGSAIGAESVYPMELLAIVAAPQLLANIKVSVDEKVTGALGCCQITNRRKKLPQLTNSHISLMGPLQHYLKEFEGTTP